jgi:hypothetical protein
MLVSTPVLFSSITAGACIEDVPTIDALAMVPPSTIDIMNAIAI